MASSEKPVVSICIPTYQGARYLRDALDGALSQTFDALEVLIVDDASTDATVAVANEYAARDGRVRVHRNPRRLGHPGNLNRCLELAAGEWIKFLFQDDGLAPACVERMVELGMRHRSWLVTCDRQFVFEEGITADEKTNFLRYVSENSLTNRFGRASITIDGPQFAAHATRHPAGNCIGEPTAVMLHRSAIERYGVFSTNLLFLADWEYWMRVAVNVGLCRVEEPLATFRQHPRGLTRDLSRRFGPIAELIDRLVLYRAMARGEDYAPVRLASRRADPPIDLEHRLLVHMLRLRRQVRHQTRDHAIRAAFTAHWNRITAEDPALAMPLWRCLARLVVLTARHRLRRHG